MLELILEKPPKYVQVITYSVSFKNIEVRLRLSTVLIKLKYLSM